MAFCCPSSANEEDLELNEKLSALEEAKGTGGVKVDSNKVSGRQNGAFKNLGLPHMVALLLCLVLIGGLLYGTFGGGGGGGTPDQLKPKQHATGPEPNTNAKDPATVSNDKYSNEEPNTNAND
eukprot:781384_1